MEGLNERNESRRFYHSVKKMRSGFHPKVNICRSKEGLLLGIDSKDPYSAGCQECWILMNEVSNNWKF